MIKSSEFVNPLPLLEPAAESGSYVLVKQNAFGAVHGQDRTFQAYIKRHVNSHWQSYRSACTTALLSSNLGLSL